MSRHKRTKTINVKNQSTGLPGVIVETSEDEHTENLSGKTEVVRDVSLPIYTRKGAIVQKGILDGAIVYTDTQTEEVFIQV